MPTDDYELIDSGNGAKLERFGNVLLDRACGQAIWPPQLSKPAWRKATAAFDRREGNRWFRRDALPDTWQVTIEGIRFRLSGTDFGHLGVFPEQRLNWRWVTRMLVAAGAEHRTSKADHRPTSVGRRSGNGGSCAFRESGAPCGH